MDGRRERGRGSRAGRRAALDASGRRDVVGRFLELIPHRRVVFSYGWEDGRMGVPPESTTVEIDLVEAGGATTVRLVHHGLPPEAVDDHKRGWAYFLGILRDASVTPADRG